MQYGDETHVVKYAYDAVGRVCKKTVTNGTNVQTITYGFLKGGHGSGSTTPLVSKITQPGLTLEYEYDNVGNITKEKRTEGSVVKEISYAYDKLGQLLRVNDPFDTTGGIGGTTWQYAYDMGGNIQSKTHHAYTTGTPAAALQIYTYEYDATWKDKLASYQIGTAAAMPITYDAIGNPLSYNGWTYTWEKGRQLQKMAMTGKTVEFLYDAAGLRTQKKVTEGSVVTTTDYFLHGKLLMHLKQKKSNSATIDCLHFFYNAQSRPQMVKHTVLTESTGAIVSASIYTYRHNLQGDVVALLDTNGNAVVTYGYDSWGKPIGTLPTTGIGSLSPFRYRGYQYDGETGLYYLRSRYYNPDWGRFVCADSLLGKIGKLLAHNSFVYCRNCPMIFIDSSGREETLIDE